MFQGGILRTVMSLTGGVLLCASAASANLITNGDFSGGTSGFTTGYSYVSPAPNTSCWPEGSYTVGTNPNLCHYLWTGFGDHTTGSGNMLIVNGAPTANVVVWSETLGIQASTNYTFSAWIASDYPSSPAQMEFLINGTQVGGTFTASTTPGQWQQFFGSWSSLWPYPQREAKSPGC